MVDKAIWCWHWGKWPGVLHNIQDVLVEGTIHGLAWTGVWMVIDAIVGWHFKRVRFVAMWMVVAFILVFEIGELVCSSVFHVYMGGEWLVLLMTSSWDELSKFVGG